MNNEDDIIVVAELSNTQRISMKRKEKSVVVQKDFRRSGIDNWTTTKGIEVPGDHIPKLIQQLEASIS